MISVGRSDRTAKLIDIPIEYSGDQLVSEGRELIDSTLESLQSDNRWWLGIGT